MSDQSIMLREFVNNVRKYADIERYSSEPIIIRKTNPVINKTVTVVASDKEPHSLSLPLNVLWIQLDIKRSDFLTMYRRESKNSSDDFENTWVPVAEYDSIFEDQIYDSIDSDSPDNIQADTDILGTVRLTVDPTNPSEPTVITEGDPTLTDKRVPLPHDEMHDPVPATRLATTGRAVVVDRGSPLAGGTMIAGHLGDSTWGQLTSNHIYPGVSDIKDVEPSYRDGLINLRLISADIVLV